MVSDSRYSMDLQIQEVLWASFAPHPSNPSSLVEERGLLNTELIQIENGNVECEICLEDKESWQMFRNDTCDHSFCYECTSKHIVARIQENLKMIRCPALNCKATLDFDVCRLMIPKNVLAQWDEFLCMSSVPESQKLFCPFRDCSAMLIDDSGQVIREIKCPVCHRSICAGCRVPWHPDFTCKEFQKLNAMKGGKEESMFKSLVQKKNWQKCPSCKIHVEKSQGCQHMTCRCGYEFCYKCGSKWGASHICQKS